MLSLKAEAHQCFRTPTRNIDQPVISIIPPITNIFSVNETYETLPWTIIPSSVQLGISIPRLWPQSAERKNRVVQKATESTSPIPRCARREAIKVQRLHPFKGPRANLACTMGEISKKGILGPGQIPACIVPALHDKVLNKKTTFFSQLPCCTGVTNKRLHPKQLVSNIFHKITQSLRITLTAIKNKCL